MVTICSTYRIHIRNEDEFQRNWLILINYIYIGLGENRENLLLSRREYQPFSLLSFIVIIIVRLISYCFRDDSGSLRQVFQRARSRNHSVCALLNVSKRRCHQHRSTTLYVYGYRCKLVPGYGTSLICGTIVAKASAASALALHGTLAGNINKSKQELVS